MQHDEMIWQVINHQFCSYKSGIDRTKKQDNVQFCKHPYSVTGLCNRTSCPLANSKYATIREDGGKVSLYIKTVERAHSPKNLWERIQLSRNYNRALEQLDEHLQYFPKVLIHRNKQRLTKIHQYLLRMRKIKLKEIAGTKARMVRVHGKIRQREERREKKALVAAKLTTNIEKELLQRLQRGTYGDLYNLNQQEEEIEQQLEEEEEEEEGLVEYVEDLEEEEEEDEIEDMEYLGEGHWGTESESSDDDDDDSSDNKGGSDSSTDEDSESDSSLDEKRNTARHDKKRRRERGARVEIEYEDAEETNELQQESVVSGMAW